MYVTAQKEDLWWTARDEIGGYSVGGKHTSLGAALEACVKHLVRGVVTSHPLTIWENVGSSSYHSTPILELSYENGRVIIDNPKKKAT